MVREIGPVLMPDGDFNFTDDINQFSWNHGANLLFLEAPLEVGFSFWTVDDHVYDDNATTTYNLLAI